MMMLVGRLKLLVLLSLLPKIVSTYEFPSVIDGNVRFIIDMCKLYVTKSVTILYSESLRDIKMTTTVFKWIRELSRNDIMLSKMYFTELQASSFHVTRTERPHYIVLLSSYKAINEFSLATNNLDVSRVVWSVVFINKEQDYDYCYDPPGNIFHLKFDTEMLVLCGKENILREWYSIYENRTEIDYFATWSMESGIVKVVPGSIYERRHNLQGVIMKAVIVKDSPFINAMDGDKLDSVFGRIFRELSATLNFTIDIVSEVEEYGIWDSKKNVWSGAIGEILAGHADISLSDFAMTSEEFEVVDFSFPLLIATNKFYIQKPRAFAIDWSSYFQVFSRSVWLTMFGVLLLVTFVLVFLKIKIGIGRNGGHLLSDVILEIWGVFCQQGLLVFPERTSLRITYISILFMSLILSTVYSATFISFLTVDVKTIPFNSLEGFVEDGTYKLAVFRGIHFYDTFAKSKNPLIKKVMNLMIKREELPVNTLEGFKKVCDNEKLAIYAKYQIRKSDVAKIPCTLVAINSENGDNLSIILSKRNPFTGIINYHLKKFFDKGIMKRIKNTEFQRTFKNKIKYSGTIPITTVISIIIFVNIGITLSIFILIIEKCIFAYKNKKKSIVDSITSIESFEFDLKTKNSMSDIVKYHANSNRRRLNINANGNARSKRMFIL